MRRSASGTITIVDHPHPITSHYGYPDPTHGTGTALWWLVVVPLVVLAALGAALLFRRWRRLPVS